MKPILSLLFALTLCLNIQAQTEWTGPTITVTKTDFADWTLEENQDRMTPNVWITRANNKGIFNIVVEPEFDNNSFLSPLDTEWAIGSINDGVGNLTFDTWDNTHGANPQSVLGIPQVVHLISDDIYVDLTMTSWTSGQNGGGGGFSYERSTAPIVEMETVPTMSEWGLFLFFFVNVILAVLVFYNMAWNSKAKRA